MDKTAILWNIETENEILKINKHKGEVISVSFNSDGDKILTGSFDYTAKIWDSFSGDLICDLTETKGEI